MSMLDRYKKGGNIMELVKLIEDSAAAKREQLLNMIRAEDSEFAAKVESRIFSYEKMRQLPEGVLAEIISATPPKFVAIVMVGEDEAFVKFAERCLGQNFAVYKEERDVMKDKPPGPQQVEAARRKMIAEARKLEAGGSIKLMSPEALAAAEKAAASGGGGGGPAPGGGALAGAKPSTLAAGSATAEQGVPPIDTFAMEAPPPGLVGERFEQFVKNCLKS